MVLAPALSQGKQAQHIEMLTAFLESLHGLYIPVHPDTFRHLCFLQKLHGIPNGRLGDLAGFRLQHLGYDPQEGPVRQLVDHGTLLSVQLDLAQARQPLAGTSVNRVANDLAGRPST